MKCDAKANILSKRFALFKAKKIRLNFFLAKDVFFYQDVTLMMPLQQQTPVGESAINGIRALHRKQIAKCTRNSFKNQSKRFIGSYWKTF